MTNKSHIMASALWCPAGLHLALLPETLNKTAGIASKIHNLYGEWTPRASCNRFHHHVHKSMLNERITFLQMQ